MAEIVPISGGPETAKIRNVIGVPALMVVTLGIYSWVWWYKINREMRDLGAKHDRPDLGTNPALSVIAITFGVLLIVPPFFSIAGTYKRAKRAQQLVGVEEFQQANPWIYLLGILFFSLFAYGYLQNELNKVWQIDGGGQSPAAAAVFTGA